MMENGSHLKFPTLSVKPPLDVDLGNVPKFLIVCFDELIDSSSCSRADESIWFSVLQPNTKENGSHL